MVVATSEIEPILSLRQNPDVGVGCEQPREAQRVPGSGGVFDVPSADAEFRLGDLFHVFHVFLA